MTRIEARMCKSFCRSAFEVFLLLLIFFFINIYYRLFPDIYNHNIRRDKCKKTDASPLFLGNIGLCCVFSFYDLS